MMGADFLFTALGIPADQVTALKALMDPEKIKATLGEFRMRFEAMEKRNLETHAMVTALHDRMLPQSTENLTADFTPEMNRQLALMIEEKGLGYDGQSDAGNRSENANGNAAGFNF